MIYSTGSNIKVFACNSNRDLAESIAKKLGLKLGDAEVEKFSDGEISVKINETIRGADVFIIQSSKRQPDGTADHDRCYETCIRRQNYSCYALLRLR